MDDPKDQQFAPFGEARWKIQGEAVQSRELYFATYQAIARHIAAFLSGSDPYAKTIVFCVDQDHADEMRRGINNEYAEFVQQYPDYVVRVVSEVRCRIFLYRRHT